MQPEDGDNDDHYLELRCTYKEMMMFSQAALIGFTSSSQQCYVCLICSVRKDWSSSKWFMCLSWVLSLWHWSTECRTWLKQGVQAGQMMEMLEKEGQKCQDLNWPKRSHVADGHIWPLNNGQFQMLIKTLGSWTCWILTWLEWVVW